MESPTQGSFIGWLLRQTSEVEKLENTWNRAVVQLFGWRNEIESDRYTASSDGANVADVSELGADELFSPVHPDSTATATAIDRSLRKVVVTLLPRSVRRRILQQAECAERIHLWVTCPMGRGS